MTANYGHGHDLHPHRSPNDHGCGSAGGDGGPPPAEWYWRPEVCPVLAARDIAALYRLLRDEGGLTQRTIARLTGQSQSEVSEILAGRRVLAYDLLVRIAEGLGIPRELMGLSYGQDGIYGEKVTDTDTAKGVSAEMMRRHVIALSAIATFGGPVVGELLELFPDPSPVPLPSRLGVIHLEKVRDLTRRLGEAGNPSISDPEVLSAATTWATRLLGVPAADPVRRALMVAVAELHIEAGWAGFDAGRYGRAMFHYARGLELATEAGNAYCQTLAMNYAGLATVEHGHPNDGLKILQIGELKALDIPPDEQRAVVIGENGKAAVEAVARATSATVLNRLGHPDAADTMQAKARQLWTPTPSDTYGDLDRPAACLELERGRLEAAEQLAAASVRRWEGGSQISRTQSGIVLATIYVKAGEPDGMRMAHHAVTAAMKITSVRVHQRLLPLIAVLEARRGPDAHELARMARQVATTQL